MKSLFLLLATGGALLGAACSHDKAGGDAVRTVKTAVALGYGEAQRLTFPGKVKAASDVNLAFRISGPIAKVYVEAGHYVRKGQVLAEMDSRDYALQLDATEAEYKQIRAEAERIMALYEKNGVTPNDYDKAVYGLKQITAKYEAHRNALADVRLCAPFDGYVQKCLFEANETVAAGTPVISMISDGLPEVEIFIPSSCFIRRDSFDSFSCAVDIFPERIFPLELVGVAQKANLNRLYAVRLRMKGATGQMPSPGMTAMVDIYLKPGGEAMVAVPLSAVFEDDGDTAVWVYSANTQSVARRRVDVGAALADGTIVVTAGLTAGESVVSAGVHSLTEGEVVKPLPAVSPSNVGGLL